MSFETERWTPLTHEQGSFFRAQLGSLASIAFAPSAHLAGIVPRVGYSYEVELPGNRIYQATHWRDPYAPATDNIMMSNNNSMNLAFVRVGVEPQRLVTRGIAVGSGAGIYGYRQQTRHEFDPRELSSTEVAAQFVMDALILAVPNVGIPPVTKEPVAPKGMRSDDIADLFRSMNSLHQNLLIKGREIGGELPVSGSHAVARILFDRVITNIHASSDTEKAQLLLSKSGTAVGAVYESEYCNGIVMLLRNEGFPDTIEISIVPRPSVDSGDIAVETYRIQPGGTVLDVGTLLPEVYSLQLVPYAVSKATERSGEPDDTPLEVLGADGHEQLFERLSKLLVEQNM